MLTRSNFISSALFNEKVTPLPKKLKWLNYLTALFLFVYRVELFDVGSLAPSVLHRNLFYSTFRAKNSRALKPYRVKYWDTPISFHVREIPYAAKSSQASKRWTQGGLFDWFKEYWMLHQAKGNYRWTTHAEFKLMFLVAMDRKGFYNTMAVSRFYLRWTSALNLLMNLSFFNASIYAFSSKLFVEEALTFNWNLSLLDYKLFKYTHQLFYFRDSSYGNESRISYLLLEDLGVDAALVTDVKAHEKNLFYLQRTNFFTIGLSPANYNPWHLSFPVPLLGDSILGQYYFFSTVIRMVGLARSSKFWSFSGDWALTKSFIRRIS